MADKKDFLDGDHSFKNWFRIMWKNGYIFIFLVGLAGMIAQIAMWNDMMEMVRDCYLDGVMGAFAVTIGMFLPIAMVGVVSYKGFYQFWNDLKNGTSR